MRRKLRLKRQLLCRMEMRLMGLVLKISEVTMAVVSLPVKIMLNV